MNLGALRKSGLGNIDVPVAAMVKVVVGRCYENEQGDIFVTTSHSLSETCSHYTFRCGQCGVETDISKSDVPWRMVKCLPTKADWLKAQKVNFADGAPAV